MPEAGESAQTDHLQDVVLEPTRNLRYCELFAVGEEWITVYNSMGLSEAPPELWDALDAEAAAEQLGANLAIKNGPHWWAADWTTLQYSVAEFLVGGIGFRIAARLPASLAVSGKLQPPFYTVAEAEKKGELFYLAGRPVHELVSPEGDVFVMQSSNIEPVEFAGLSERLKPEEGWQFRTRAAEEDMTVVLEGTVKVVMDELRNVYNYRG